MKMLFFIITAMLTTPFAFAKDSPTTNIDLKCKDSKITITNVDDYWLDAKNFPVCRNGKVRLGLSSSNETTVLSDNNKNSTFSLSCTKSLLTVKGADEYWSTVPFTCNDAGQIRVEK
jgi:hypothetical protein